MDPKRNSRRSDLGKAEEGGLNLRETDPRSPTPSLADRVRPKPQAVASRCRHGHVGQAGAVPRQGGMWVEGVGGAYNFRAYAFSISLCLSARSSDGCIFMSWNSEMAQSRCSSASARSFG